MEERERVMNDNEIIDLYLARDESAISATAERYGAYLSRIAYNILSDDFEAEECVSDTYYRAWRRIPPEIPQYFSAFLAKITRNLALDRKRASGAAKRAGAEALVSLDELAECVGEEDRRMEREEIARCINLLLSRSDELKRRVFVLRYFHEMSVADIASALGIGVPRVKTMLHRMRMKLKEIMDSEGVYL